MAGIEETVGALRKKHMQFIEANYHIHDSELIFKRREIINSETDSGVWIEKTPIYKPGHNISDLNLPETVKSILNELSEKGAGVFNPPYTHQSNALESFFNGKNIVVSTGTGSGKTEIFLHSILGMLAQEGHKKGDFPRGMRAIILYPMNSLVSDQLSRLRKMFGKNPGKDIIAKHFGRTVQFGMFTGRTPYYGIRDSKKDSQRIKPIIDYYLSLKGDKPDVYERLDNIGRIPAKDLENYSKDYSTQPMDAELFSRQEMYEPNGNGGTPEILITNYYMLEYILLRAVEQPLLNDTKAWLEADEDNKLLLIIDEAHLYYGAQGAEVSMLINRLLMRLGISTDKVRFILTSASLGDEKSAEKNGVKFASDLTGCKEDSFVLIKGIRKEIEEGLEGDAQAFLKISQEKLWENPKELERTNSYKRMMWLLNQRAFSIKDLSHNLFPGINEEEAESVVIKMLDSSIKTDSNVSKDSMKIHMFFRGMDKQHLCLNPNCGKGKYGKMYMGARETCEMCGCRTYEILTHRTCGAAFIRGYIYKNRATPHKFFLWNRGTEEFYEQLLSIEESPDTNLSEPLFLNPKTGFVSESFEEGYIKVYGPKSSNKDKKRESLSWKKCPICKERSENNIMDLETKGEEVFSNLTKTLFELQPKVKDHENLPNGGKKILCFSDSRKKAAKLARDVQVNIEQDAFKEVLVAAYSKYNLKDMSDLFSAFVNYCHQNRLSFFDDSDEQGSRSVFERIKNKLNGRDRNILHVVDRREEKNVPQFQQRLLKAIGDKHYSLTASLVGSVIPTEEKMQAMYAEFNGEPKEDIRGISTYIIWNALQKRAYDPYIDREIRSKSRQTSRDSGIRGDEGLSSEEIISGSIMKIFKFKNKNFWGSFVRKMIELEIFIVSSDDGRYYVNPSNVTLDFTLGSEWYKCDSCWAFHPCDLGGICPKCMGSVSKYDAEREDLHTESRKALYREPHKEILKGSRVPITIRSEEHTAQLGYRDEAVPMSKTEDYELSFQDILTKGEKESQPIDILSCTTTMEVGIDIGSLTAVALRTVPPRSDNYQQRSGRAGRRNNNLSTVITYVDNKPYELQHFKNPGEIINGKGRDPIIYTGNIKICKRHINASLLNIFFFEIQDSRGESIFSAMGSCKDFFENQIDSFRQWIFDIIEGRDPTLFRLGKILPSELQKSFDCNEKEWENVFIKETSKELIDILYRVKETNDYDDDEELIPRLLKLGVLPSFSFPLDVGRFIVYKKETNQIRQPIEYESLENLKQALSDYVPGKEIIIDKKTFESKGLSFPYSRGPDKAEGKIELKKIKICVNCDSLVYDSDYENCTLCKSVLKEMNIVKPEAFSPEYKGGTRTENVEDSKYSITSAAALPVEKYAEREEEDKKVIGHMSVERGYNTSLKIINYGHEREGFKICKKCGRMEHMSKELGSHWRPYPSRNKCNSKEIIEGTVLGYDLITDIVSFKISDMPEISFDYNKFWVKVVAISLTESLLIAASRVLEIDSRELSGGYRITKNETDLRTIMEIFLYDATPSGAGFSSKVFERVEDVIEKTEELLSSCNCDSSCQMCLRTYENKANHNILDRKMALKMLEYAKTGIISPLENKDAKKLIGIFTDSIQEMLPDAAVIETGHRGVEIIYRDGKKSITFTTFLEDKDYSNTGTHISDFEADYSMPEVLEKIRVELNR